MGRHHIQEGDGMTKYKVTFTETPTKPSLVCDKDTILDALGRLPGAQVDDIFMHILDWRMRHGDKQDTDNLMSYLFLNFRDDTPVGYIKRDLINADLEWILDRVDRDPALLTRSYYDGGIEVEEDA